MGTEIPNLLLQSGIHVQTLRSTCRLAPLSSEDIRNSLLNPIWPDGSRQTVFERIRPGERVCFVVSDHTRKSAMDRVLPIILEGLEQRGCSGSDFFVLVASGIHRHPRPDEQRAILGPAFGRLEGRIFLHDCDDATQLVEVGITRRGHPVRVNRQALEADRLILTGSVTYHYHAGFGGGRKALVPGLASRETIAWDHSLTLDPHEDRIDPRVALGQLDGNPVAEEMMEGARLCKPDMIVNTVLSPDHQILGVFSGELDAAHRAACRLVETVCRVNIAQPADLVIAWTTAANWVQSHKALFNAHRALKPGGTLILVAPCPEGLGDSRFRYWVTRPTIADLYRELRKSVEILGQTALSSRIRGADAILVTGMPEPDARDLGIRTAPDLETAIRRVLAGTSRPEGMTCYLIPEASHLVPFPAPG
jgi:nickel-dependent lactate racemase